MTDQALDILKLVLLALLYLFFARVLWAVWSEVRAPAELKGAVETAPPANGPAAQRGGKPPKGKRGTPARLVVLEPKTRRGTTFAIDGAVTIGRDHDNTILISDDTYVSSHHATITRDGAGVTIDDHGSRNGTYLNGTRLTVRHPLRTGDRVQIGVTVLEAQ
jgi:pSer/pThr/pTyr-binding forkhead associated (FHA) protein